MRKRIISAAVSVVTVVLTTAPALVPSTALAAFIQEQKVVASDGATNDFLGLATALSSDGSYMVVGSRGDDVGANADQGSVYVYTRSGSVWTQQQKLTASDGAASDFFGFSVDINSTGTRIAVGANQDDVGANANQGSVYVFSRSGTVWTQEQKLTASDGAAGDALTNGALAINSDGSRIVAGAPFHAVGANANQGAAYVFSRSGTVWTQEQKLTASDGAASSFYGRSGSINVDATRIAVSAARADIGANVDQGAVYIYSRSGTVWTQEKKLTASDGAANDQFGVAVALNSNATRIVVGAYLDDVGANANQGSVYVFSRSGTVWTQEQKLTASDGAANDFFAQAVGIDGTGTRIVVGSPNNDVGVNTDQGSAYVFLRSGTVWTQEQQLTASDGAAGDLLGFNAAISSNGIRVAAGAYRAEIGANVDQGAEYVFRR